MNSILRVKWPFSVYLSLQIFKTFLVKIESIDDSEIETVEFHESDSETIDCGEIPNLGQSSTVMVPGTSQSKSLIVTRGQKFCHRSRV